MAEQAVKMCGVCKRHPRGDDPTHPMRLHADDVAGETPAVEPGLYQSCRDCIAKFKPKIEARLRKTPLIDDATGRPVWEWDQDGKPVKPVMTLGPNQPMSRNHLF